MVAQHRIYSPATAGAADPADAALELTVRTAARDGLRICLGCAEDLPLTAFPKRGRGRSLTCARCMMAETASAAAANTEPLASASHVVTPAPARMPAPAPVASAVDTATADYDDDLAFEADRDAAYAADAGDDRDGDDGGETGLSLLEALQGRMCSECNRDMPLAAFPPAAHGMARDRGHVCEDCVAKARAKRERQEPPSPTPTLATPTAPSAAQTPKGWRALQTTARPPVLAGTLTGTTTTAHPAHPATTTAIREMFAPEVWEAVAAHTRRLVEETASAVAREMAAAAIREATRDAVREIVRELLLCADRLIEGRGEGGAAHVHD